MYPDCRTAVLWSTLETVNQPLNNLIAFAFLVVKGPTVPLPRAARPPQTRISALDLAYRPLLTRSKLNLNHPNLNRPSTAAAASLA